MRIEIKVPMLPESVADATVITWHKKPGERVERDENIVDLETDKVVLEVPAPEGGVLGEILKKEGTVVKAGEVLTILDKSPSTETVERASVQPTLQETIVAPTKKEMPSTGSKNLAGPAARRSAAEQGVSLQEIPGSGRAGRVTRQDVLDQVHPITQPIQPVGPKDPLPSMSGVQREGDQGWDRMEKRVPMTRLRAMIAKRLLAVQHSAAILTTFNEINLQKIIELRATYKDSFEKKHGVRLGFMSFFTKAATEALKQYPAVNASIDGDDIIYHGYFDIGIALSTDRGLLVPILRNADKLSFTT